MALLTLLCLLLAAPGPYRPAKQGILVRLTETGILGGGPGYTLDVLPDGTVRERGKVLPARMTPKQVQALLVFIIEKQKLPKYDEAAVARGRKKAPGVCGTGATTTKIQLFVAGHTKTVEVTQLRLFAGFVPELRPVVAVDDRLRLEARLAKHGGRARVAAWLAIANKHPTVKGQKPLTLAHFVRADDAGAVFERRTEAPPTLLTAVVKGAKAKVTLLK